MVSELCERVRGAGYELEITEEAVALIAKRGYDVRYGARNLSRDIVRLIENPISEEILRGCPKKIVFGEERLRG